MRRAAARALLLAVATVGMSVSGTSMAIEDPFSGEYIYSPLRTLTLDTPVSEYGKVVEAMRRFAEAGGYKIRVGSPSGRPESSMDHHESYPGMYPTYALLSRTSVWYTCEVWRVGRPPCGTTG